jgi:hypothetical protein
MTAQIAERLIFEGQEHALLSNPLSEYFALGGERPDFQSTSTALWRGYVGTWEVVSDRLYMVAIKGWLESGQEASLETVFPGFPNRVFAHWFTGKLRIPQGRQLEYVHMGYASSYEQDLFLSFKNGLLTGKEVQVNDKAPESAPDGCGIGAMTVWSIQNKEDQS